MSYVCVKHINYNVADNNLSPFFFSPEKFLKD